MVMFGSFIMFDDSTEAERMAYPPLNLIPQHIWRRYFREFITKDGLALMEASNQETVKTLLKTTEDIPEHYWLAIALSHPLFTDDDLFELANIFSLQPDGLFQYVLRVRKESLLEAFLVRYQGAVVDMFQKHDYQLLHVAAEEGNIANVKRLLRLCPENQLEMIRSRHYAAFHHAAAQGHTDIMELFFNLAPDDIVLMIESQQFWAFWQAVRNGQIQAIELILSKYQGEAEHLFLQKSHAGSVIYSAVCASQRRAVDFMLPKISNQRIGDLIKDYFSRADFHGACIPLWALKSFIARDVRAVEDACLGLYQSVLLWPVSQKNDPVIYHLLSLPTVFDAARAHKEHKKRIPKFIDEKVLELRSRGGADLLPYEVECAFLMLRTLLSEQRVVHLESILFLLSIPELLARAKVASRELLDHAIYFDSKKLIDLLIPRDVHSVSLKNLTPELEPIHLISLFPARVKTLILEDTPISPSAFYANHLLEKTERCVSDLKVNDLASRHHKMNALKRIELATDTESESQVFNEIIHTLERMNTPGADLTAALLLSNSIEDVLPCDFGPYHEKRLADAIGFLVKAQHSQRLKPICDFLLWEMKTLSQSKRISNYLASFSIDPGFVIQSYSFFSRRPEPKEPIVATHHFLSKIY